MRIPARALPAFLALCMGADQSTRRVVASYADLAARVNARACKMPAAGDDAAIDDATSERTMRRACDTLQRAGCLTRVRNTGHAIEFEIPAEFFPTQTEHYPLVREDRLCVSKVDDGPVVAAGPKLDNRPKLDAQPGQNWTPSLAKTGHPERPKLAVRTPHTPQKTEIQNPTPNYTPGNLDTSGRGVDGGGGGESRSERGEGIDVDATYRALTRAGVSAPQVKNRIAASVPTAVVEYAIRKALASKQPIGAMVKALSDPREVISLREAMNAAKPAAQPAAVRVEVARQAIAERAADDAAIAENDALIDAADGSIVAEALRRIMEAPPADFPKRFLDRIAESTRTHGLGASPNTRRLAKQYGRGWIAAIIRDLQATGRPATVPVHAA